MTDRRSRVNVSHVPGSEKIILSRGEHVLHLPVTQAVRVADRIIDLVEADRNA